MYDVHNHINAPCRETVKACFINFWPWRCKKAFRSLFPPDGVLLQVEIGYIARYAPSSTCKIPLAWRKNRLDPIYKTCLKRMEKSGQIKTLRKIAALFEELQKHPATGTGQVEQLKGNLQGFWSRRIDKSARMIYTIEEETVRVLVVSIKGHYEN